MACIYVMCLQEWREVKLRTHFSSQSFFERFLVKDFDNNLSPIHSLRDFPWKAAGTGFTGNLHSKLSNITGNRLSLQCMEAESLPGKVLSRPSSTSFWLTSCSDFISFPYLCDEGVISFAYMSIKGGFQIKRMGLNKTNLYPCFIFSFPWRPRRHRGYGNVEKGFFGNSLIVYFSQTLLLSSQGHYRPYLNPRMPSSHACQLHALMLRP